MAQCVPHESGSEELNELAIETFGRAAPFDVHPDKGGISLTLHRSGAGEVPTRLRFHTALFADILSNLAETVSTAQPADAFDRAMLRDSANALFHALDEMGDESSLAPRQTVPQGQDREDISRLTPDEEVLLLHVLE